jgi:N-acetylglucosaminyldiphosphoundecaprenol N-acetyl-beta-D-mannosaminyltransferase
VPVLQEGIRRFDVLGVQISAVRISTAVAEILECLRKGTKIYVCVTGVHGVMESQKDSVLKTIHNSARLVTPDGMPLVWLGKLAGVDIDRVYGPDLMLALCRATERTGARHFLYGAGEGVAELLADRLRAQFPDMVIAGKRTPLFRPLSKEEDRIECDLINAAHPDIVWVGLSTPKQERWMADHRDQLSAPVLIGVGAAFDFHAGLKKQAPRWIQRSGLEWLFRLCIEPRRLWKRYLTNNPMFLSYLFLQFLGLRSSNLRTSAKGKKS